MVRYSNLLENMFNFIIKSNNVEFLIFTLIYKIVVRYLINVNKIIGYKLLNLLPSC